MNIDAITDQILGNEGGFVNNDNDKGGPTQWGVSLRFARSLAFVNGKSPMDLNGDGVVDVKDIKLVTRAIAAKLYVDHFLKGTSIDKLPDCVQPQLYDMSVNAGPGGAAKTAQIALVQNGLFCTVDGSIGPQTIGLMEKLHTRLGDKQLINAVVRARLAYYDRVVAADPGDKVFLNGWRNRANEFKVAA